jgi:hypothetical protein
VARPEVLAESGTAALGNRRTEAAIRVRTACWQLSTQPGRRLACRAIPEPDIQQRVMVAAVRSFLSLRKGEDHLRSG